MKKLFSYLLISSMVVLSSCTNYDDQFDDLNTQINTLKSQIEGFSSLSSGLTALQGTVASLQSAINNIPVTPATDISGLEASLTKLATEVTALQTSLATAATAAEVAALSTSLAAVQADLADLLASNNIYTGDVTINSASTLAAAEALGNKLAIVNGSVTITQTDTTIDATKLQAVTNKIVTATGSITYTQSGTGVTSVSFDSLTGVGNLTVDIAAGAISFPKLASAGVVYFENNSKVTSVSAPKLVSVSSFSDGTLNSLDFSSGATSIDFASLATYPNASLTIKGKSTSTIDLTALATVDKTTGAQKTLALTIDGPKVVTLPGFKTGTLTTDAEVVTLVNALTTPSFTDDNLKELHMHNLQGPLVFTLADHPNLEILDIIGTQAGSTSAEASYNASVSVEAGTDLTTVTLAGLITTATIAGNNVTSVTTSGGINNFSITGTSVSELSLGHTSKVGASFGSLAIVNNTDMTSASAATLDDIKSLTITGNTSLTTLSFPALNSLGVADVDGTALAAGDTSVNIYTNALAASNIQLASEEDAAVTVVGKVTTNSGLTALETYIAAAYAKATAAKIQIDEVAQITLADGTVKTEAYQASSGVNEDLDFDGEGTAVILAQKIAASGATISQRLQKGTGTLSMTTPSLSAGISITSDGTNVDAQVRLDDTRITSTTGFNVTIPSTYMSAVQTELNRQLTENGKDVSVAIANDFGISVAYDINGYNNGVADSRAEGIAGLVTSATNSKLPFSFNGTQLSATLTTGSNIGEEQIVTAMRAALRASTLTRSFFFASAGKRLVAYPAKMVNGSVVTDVFKSYTSFPSLAVTGYTNALSLTSVMGVSSTIAAQNISSTKDWRLTLTNNSTAIKSVGIDTGAFINGNISGTTVFTDALAGNALSATDYYVEWDDVRAASAGTYSAGTSFSYVSFL